MSDLIEFVLNVVLELVCDIPNVQEYWRFVLPLLGAAAIVGLILWRVSQGSVQLALCVPVVLAGIGAGIFWQGRGS